MKKKTIVIKLICVFMISLCLLSCDIRKDMNMQEATELFDYTKELMIDKNVQNTDRYYYSDNKTIWYISEGNSISDKAILKIINSNFEQFYYDGFVFTHNTDTGQKIKMQNSNNKFEECRNIKAHFVEKIMYILNCTDNIEFSGIKTNAQISKCLFVTMDRAGCKESEFFSEIDSATVSIFFHNNEIASITLETYKAGICEVELLDFIKYFSDSNVYTTIPFSPGDLDSYELIE